jgi:Caspase domain
MSNVFAYLVGIDRYAGNVTSLHGCVNDIDAITEVLRSRATMTGDRLTLTTLTNENATRQAFIDGFRAHFAAAREGDIALLYCSMHGSQERAAPEFLSVEPDGFNETLVLHDSRTNGGRDLADKELSVLVGELSRRVIAVTVVLDTCHSGSGVRGLSSDLTVRAAPADLRRRGAQDYLPGAVPAPGAVSADLGARYTLLAACRSDQTAKESDVAGLQRGALSLALQQVLVSSPGPVSNLEVHRAVSARVRARVSDQTPQLECTEAGGAYRAFLGGALAPARGLMTASRVGGRWQLDVGRVHGLPVPGPDGGVRVALHPLASGEPDRELAVAVTTEVGASSSALRFDSPEAESALDPAAGYRAVIISWPPAATTIAVAGDVPRRDTVVAALGALPSLTVEDTDPDLAVTVSAGEVLLSRPGSARPLIAAQPAETLDVARLADEAAHVGRWLALADLANPGTTIAAGAVRLDALAPGGTELPLAESGIEVAYEPDGAGGWSQPRIQLRVRNAGPRRVYVALLALTELYGIGVLNLEGNGTLDPAGGEATGETFAVADDGSHDLYLEVPEAQERITDVLKLLVSTVPFDVELWQQPNLEPPVRTRSAFLADRTISGRPAARVPADDWTTRELVVTTTRPPLAFRLDRSGGSLELADGVTLHSPGGLSCTVALTGHVSAARDALVPLLPPIFASDPASEAFALVPTRSPGAEVDVLQLSWSSRERGTESAVTSDAPLRLVVDQPLSDAEVVLPIAFDGEDYLPVGVGLGRDGRTEIRIDRLPVTDIGLRSLGGSLKILFRKLVLRPLGVRYDWPRLSVVDYTTDPPSYDWDPEHVRAALAGKSSALLLVHGIIGDTLGMSVSVAAGSDPVRNRFGTVLAFDYENIRTPIEQTGLELAERLRAVGIGADGAPHVTAVVHSMGGLVTRWCIERGEGAPPVDRLITCGTPHGGSPWSRAEDLALSLTGLALNGVVYLGGPFAVAGCVLGYLTKLTERLDNTLDEMRPGSALLSALATDPDPGLPYTTIRGTRPWPDPADDSRAKRIIAKLATQGFDTVFAEAVNDMAVSTVSASAVGAAWAAEPRRIDADCNHISYFSSEAGRNAITRALGG